MAGTRQVTISTDTLSAIRGLSEEQAKKIIHATANAIVDGHPPVKTNLTGKSIIIEVSPGLREHRCIIVLTAAHGQMVAVLGYDPKTGKLSHAKEKHDRELPLKTDVISAIDKAAATVVDAVTLAGRRRKKGG